MGKNVLVGVFALKATAVSGIMHVPVDCWVGYSSGQRGQTVNLLA